MYQSFMDTLHINLPQQRLYEALFGQQTIYKTNYKSLYVNIYNHRVYVSLVCIFIGFVIVTVL
jgi:hypothetical protein